MIFSETKIKGVYIINLEPIKDHRGFFARGWCKKEFEANGLNPEIVQINIGFSKKKGGVNVSLTERGIDCNEQYQRWNEDLFHNSTLKIFLDKIVMNKH